MFLLNYEEIKKRIENINEIGIIVLQEYATLIEEIYPKIQSLKRDLEIFILSGDTILCSSKFNKFDFYVVIGVECPLHKFKNACYINFEPNDLIKDKISKFKGRVIFDSTYCSNNSDVKDDLSLEVSNLDINKTQDENTVSNNRLLIVSDNPSFMKYYATRKDCEFISEYKGESKMDFMMTRINKAEKVRNKKIFAIIFTSSIFEEIAIKVKNQIVNSGRFAYLLHLKNVHYNRLITIEGVDALVLVDCPLSNNLNIDIFIPIVTPYEINYILSGEWDDKYEENKINEQRISTCTDLTQVKGAGELILQSGFIGIEYGKNDEDYKIYEGRSGIAESYEHEIK